MTKERNDKNWHEPWEKNELREDYPPKRTPSRICLRRRDIAQTIQIRRPKTFTPAAYTEQKEDAGGN
jgi:hypothetical protein